jgi:4,5-DOPA dioxygenase extradiol
LNQQTLSLSSAELSEKPLPVLFLGHGNPMNAIEDNEYRRSWVDLGTQFGPGQRWALPRLIVCVSAHWLTDGWQITANENPRTIHDFGGFPQALLDQQYPAPGDPAAAQAIAGLLSPAPDGAGVSLSNDWGLDHGSWSVLKPMFPSAQIPVLQLSMDYARPVADHFAVGRQLQNLRRQGVLIVASGNTVHNLRSLQMHMGSQEALDWARSFDDWVAARISAGEPEALVDFQERDQEASLAHPSFEHFLPLLYAAGAASDEDTVSYFNTGFQLGSIAMRSVVWDSV